MNTDNDDDKIRETPLLADNSDEQQESPDAPESIDEPTQTTSVARGLFRLFALLILVLLLGGAAAAGGWFGWQWLQEQREQQAQQFEQQAQQFEQQAKRLTALDARLSRLSETHVSRDAFESLRDDVARAQRDLQNDLEQFAGEMQDVREAARGGRRDLALGEIEYLLRIGADALYLAKDIDTAIYALQAADDRLRQMGEPRLNAVRERIADHLQALNAVSMPDTQGIAMKLGSMMRQVSRLPLKQAQHARTAAETTASAAEGIEWWQRLRNGFQRMFNKLVVVQRAEPPPALLTPEEHFFLYRNVELQFSAARAALLANDANSYRQSLEMSREWMNAYFDTSEPRVQNMLADISGLLDVPLQPDLPDINAALERFRALAGSNRVGARTE